MFVKVTTICTFLTWIDIAISNYFNPGLSQTLRYGENPHQKAVFHGNLAELFTQLNGKELSYNNLVDVDAAVQLIADFTLSESEKTDDWASVFAIIKHTNVCGIASRPTVKESWDSALAGDPESAFGGVLVCNQSINKETAEAINEIFFEVLIAPAFDADALEILKSKKNRILLQFLPGKISLKSPSKSLLNGTLEQDSDEGNFSKWEEVGGRETTESEKEELRFANIICKH